MRSLGGKFQRMTVAKAYGCGVPYGVEDNVWLSELFLETVKVINMAKSWKCPVCGHMNCACARWCVTCKIEGKHTPKPKKK